MSILKKVLSKINTGFYYIVNEEVFKQYLEKELTFSLEHNLEASADLNIYLLGEKHHIQIWNYDASEIESERVKGLVVYYDKEEYKTLDDLYQNRLNNLPQYFKIELLVADDVFLNNYKEEHPELIIDDYN